MTQEKYCAAIQVAEAFADRLADKSELLKLTRLSKAKGADRAALLVAAKHASLATLRLAMSEARSAAANRLYQANLGDALDVESNIQADFIRDVFGYPFRFVEITHGLLAWNDETVVKVAKKIYDDRAFERLPILADAIEEAGCHDAAMLDHCRQPGVHIRGCWLIDLLLGKE